MIMFLALLLALALQRGLELLLALSNTAQLRRQGGQEIGSGHYPVMVALHIAWFVSMLCERTCHGPWGNPSTMALGWSFLLLGQGLRWWTISTLGRRWTTRIMVLPGAPLVEGGPFRLLRHPNYLGVMLEIVGVPMIGGCWRTMVVLGGLHLAFLIFRMRIENRALRDLGCLPETEVRG